MTRDPADLDALVRAAREGDAGALERLVERLYPDLYRLALRMTASPADAEDATQDVMVRVITRLGGFRGDAKVTTWAYRIAVNVLLDRRKSCAERERLTFDRFAADLLDGLAAGPSSAPDAELLAREVMLACTHVLLTCLDREQRVVYVLADVLGVSAAEGAEICEVSPDAYRQRLSRARRRVRGHLREHCGLVSEQAPCRCDRRVDAAVRLGRADPGHLEYADERVVAATADLERMHDAASLLRALPPARVPDGGGPRIRELLAASRHL